MVLDVQRLRSELDELDTEATTWSQPAPAGTEHWRDRLFTLIAEISGPKDGLAIRLAGFQWKSGVPSFPSPIPSRQARIFGAQPMWGEADMRALQSAKTGAADIIKSLRWHLDRMAPATAPYSDATVDPELWEHVRGLVETGDWEKVAREAAILVESKLRDWASVPQSVTGSVRVFQAAINANAFNLGKAGQSSEVDGWRQLATGFSLALRNPSGHQVKNRPDAKRYALGVLGAASLLLTQIRFEYGDPPKP